MVNFEKTTTRGYYHIWIDGRKVGYVCKVERGWEANVYGGYESSLAAWSWGTTRQRCMSLFLPRFYALPNQQSIS